jgi:hypothetical protein
MQDNSKKFNNLRGLELRHNFYFRETRDKFIKKVLSENVNSITIGLTGGRGYVCCKSKYLEIFPGISPDYLKELISKLKSSNIEAVGRLVFNVQDIENAGSFLTPKRLSQWKMHFLDEPNMAMKNMPACVSFLPLISSGMLG